MNNFVWQHIEFEHGGNPYICTTEKEFNRIKREYNLVKVKDNFWFAKNEQMENMFYNDLRMEQREQM